jgi:diguanylate cyclase (GGDEF)-like protein
MELLLADSSRARLETAATHPRAGAPGCTVGSPFACVAVRRGNASTFENSTALNACPYLRSRSSQPLAAVCVPVGFKGRTLGVIHAAGPTDTPLGPAQVAALTTLGIQTGIRIGTLRAFERTQIRATTDGLTGLSNRRTLEYVLRKLLADGRRFAFVMGDLDHFKRLNDSHGHHTGDRALQLFSEVARSCMRREDHAARWGGEEFAFVLDGVEAGQALAWVDRLRGELARAEAVAGSVPFTASFGIADSTLAGTLDEIVSIADVALYRAKTEGRDRGVIGRRGDTNASASSCGSEHSAALDFQLLASEM